MLDKLLLLSGNEIPFIQAQLTVHQPTLKEIAYIGEESFFVCCEYLNFSKNKLKEQDKNHLGSFSSFEILMTMIKEDNEVVKKYKTCMELVLLLLFPQYRIDFLPNSTGLCVFDQMITGRRPSSINIARRIPVYQ